MSIFFQISLCLLLLINSACNHSSSSNEHLENSTQISSVAPDENSWTPESSPIPESGVPDLASTFDANVGFINFTQSQEEKYLAAVEILKKVVASEEFMRKVLDFTYQGQKIFVDNGGLTNLQIYQKILEGSETLLPSKNNALDLDVELYYENTTTIGYTYPNTTQIWVNTKYFSTFSVAAVAANLMHEWLHKLGFGHDVEYSPARDSSVPYAVGRIVNTLGVQYLP